jgi:hypothetical protein
MYERLRVTESPAPRPVPTRIGNTAVIQSPPVFTLPNDSAHFEVPKYRAPPAADAPAVLTQQTGSLTQQFFSVSKLGSWWQQ